MKTDSIQAWVSFSPIGLRAKKEASDTNNITIKYTKTPIPIANARWMSMLILSQVFVGSRGQKILGTGGLLGLFVYTIFPWKAKIIMSVNSIKMKILKKDFCMI